MFHYDFEEKIIIIIIILAILKSLTPTLDLNLIFEFHSKICCIVLFSLNPLTGRKKIDGDKRNEQNLPDVRVAAVSKARMKSAPALSSPPRQPESKLKDNLQTLSNANRSKTFC